MPDKKIPRLSNAEIKAGVFLTFCLALFVGMLFVLGKFGRVWNAKQSVDVIFTQANALRRDAPVRYNGMDAGHVKAIKIVRLDEKLMARMPVLAKRHLDDLPLSDEERESLQTVPDDKFDAVVREKIKDHTMVLLTLDLMSEQDACRYRIDDEFRIVGNVLGDSSMEIHTGSGQIIAPSYDKVFLGIGGDMYSDLGRSIAEVKDILGSLSEMVGGDTGRRTLQDQLGNFENFTIRIESASDSIGNKLPTIWDNVDGRIDSTKTTVSELDEKLLKMKPKFEEALQEAQKAIGELRKNTAEAVQDAHVKLAERRKDMTLSLGDWKKMSGEYRELIPEQIKNVRDWSDRFKTWPWSYANKPDEEQGFLQQTLYRRDLARRQYAELRAELQRVRDTLQAPDSSDRSRVARIDELLREQDLFFGVGNANAAPADDGKKKGKKR